MPGNKRVLYISYDGMTDPLGQSQVIPYLQGLSKAGYEITLMSFEKSERSAAQREEVARLLKNNNIVWEPLSYTKKPAVLSTVYDLNRMKAKAVELHRQNPFALVHCRSYIAAFAGLMMKRKFGTKFLFDMRGFYADERVDGAIWNRNNPLYNLIYNFFKQKEKEFLSNADYVVSLTHKAKKIIHSWKEISNQPIPIQGIPCCADLDFFSAKNVDANRKAELQKELELTGNEFVLCYLGSVGTWYMLDEMLDFFACLLKRNPDSKFLFITNDNPGHILQRAIAKGIPVQNVIGTPSKRSDLPTYLSLCNWSIFFIKPVFSKSASSPTKQGELMGMGIPHVCNTGVGDVDEIVSRNGVGLSVQDFTEEEYNRVIDQMLQNTEANTQAIAAAAREVYSLQSGVLAYQTIYRQLTTE
jgi:glycosyltransferase involved in cell wall biosynthesis